MTERNFNVAMNEELTPSVQPVKTFSGASHKTLARYVNDTESTMPKNLNVSIACQRFQLAGIIVLADGENFSSVDVTATAYKNHENRKYQLATETISLPATNAGNMGYIAATMSGYEDFVDSIAFSGTISIAAGGSVTIIALFKGGEDSALANLSSKIDEIADNTAIQQPYRLLGVDSNGVLTGNTTTKKKIDISGATDVEGVLGFYAKNNTAIEGALDFSSLTALTKDYSFIFAFSGAENITSFDFSNLAEVSGQYVFQNAFENTFSLKSISFPELEIVSGLRAFYNAFIGSGAQKIFLPKLKTAGSSGYTFYYAFSNCASLNEIDLSSLENIISTNGFSRTFSGCTSLTTISFPKLSNLDASAALSSAFTDCTALTDVYFNSLKTTSFGSSYTSQFSGMLTGDTDVKLHFPSNLTATIASLNGYPNFGGTNSQVLFDLPATE